MSHFSGKKSIICFMMLSLLLILTACNSGNNSTGDEKTKNNDNSRDEEVEEPDTVTVYAKEGLEEPFEKIVDEFSKENEDIIVDVQYLNNEDIENEALSNEDNSIIFSTEDIINQLVEKDSISHKNTGVAMMDELVLFKKRDSSDIQKTGDIDEETRIGILNPDLYEEGQLSKKAFEEDEFEQVDTDKNLILGDSIDDVKQDVMNNNAQVGVLYSSNIYNDSSLTAIKRLPRRTVEPYIYQAGIVTQNDLDNSTEKVYDYLLSNDTLDIFEDYGYII